MHEGQSLTSISWSKIIMNENDLGTQHYKKKIFELEGYPSNFIYQFPLPNAFI